MNGNLLAIRHMSKTKKNDFGGDGGVVINISSVKGILKTSQKVLKHRFKEALSQKGICGVFTNWPGIL